METNPQNNGQNTTPQELQENNPFGWTLFIVTIGVAIYQIYLHGYEIFYRYIPIFSDGRFFRIFTNTDPFFGRISYKVFEALFAFNDFFITALLIVTMVFMLLRKKATLVLLIVFVSFAGLFTLFIGIIMQNIIYSGTFPITPEYNLESAGFLAADILLFFLYLKSKKFRMLFTR